MEPKEASFRWTSAYGKEKDEPKVMEVQEMLGFSFRGKVRPTQLQRQKDWEVRGRDETDSEDKGMNAWSSKQKGNPYEEKRERMVCHVYHVASRSCVKCSWSQEKDDDGQSDDEKVFRFCKKEEEDWKTYRARTFGQMRRVWKSTSCHS